MWLLIITMWSSIPGATTSNGSIHARFGDHEQCLRAKEQIEKRINIDNYRLVASCTFRG